MSDTTYSVFISLISLMASKVLPVKKQVAFSENNVSCIPELVLLTNVYHIEVLFVEEFELLSAAIKVGEGGEWEEWPHHELFDHDLAGNHSKGARGQSVEGWSDVAVVDVLSSDHVGPVSFSGCRVLMRCPLKELLLNEVHSEMHGCLVLLWNATVCLIEMVEVILVARLQLLSQKNRHNKI